ncbi:multicopper oxidase family protein [Zavarzinia sp.]|uniref:multicopper oxidase family protein n=1 Tax=Zavarzinia sp. TaxID=2027920 RepID=UPI003568A589
MAIHRRDLLKAGSIALFALPLSTRLGHAAPGGLVLEAKPRPLQLPTCSAPTTAWTYAEQWPLELRIRHGETFRATFLNHLAEHSSIHWHGLRIPQAMDGVPYVTQDPIQPGQSFDYEFTPPDPGFFFFHPHCDDITALAHGLAGVLIVEDPREDGLFDLDRTLVLMDWRVRPDGSYDTITTDKNAARAGTFGRLRTTNGQIAPRLTVRPGSRVRLRCIGVDASRIPLIDVVGAEAKVIATDGNACTPFALPWPLGPAQRAEIAFVAPPAGQTVELQDIWQSTPVTLARIVSEGEPIRVGDDRPLALPAAALPEPDLDKAEQLRLDLGAGVSDPAIEEFVKLIGGAGEICSTQRVFWSLNTKAWPGMGPGKLPEALARLQSGKSYVITLFNGTPHRHPIHLHGHSFKVLDNQRADVPAYWADTVLVEPKERIRIAFVAGLPGKWMVHCHIIEHQETGMMGYYEVV